MVDSLTHEGLAGRSRSAAQLRLLGIPAGDLLLVSLGALLLLFLGWSWNSPLAAWLAPLFLIRFFRNQRRWYTALLAMPLLCAAFVFTIAGKWELSLVFVLGVSFLRSLPYLAALFTDRFLAPRLGPVAATLVYPATFVVGDFLFSFGPVGSIFSPGATQFSFPSLVQLAAWTGVFGISFATGWFAATANAVWENGFDLRRVARPVLVFGAVLGVILAGGGLRLALFPPDAETVRIGAVSAAHANNYWDEIDAGVPPSGAERLGGELRELEEQLFRASERAVASGAKIVFWSEGNAVLYKDDEPRFFQRAGAFARERGVYLAPGMLVLHPGRGYAENKVVLFGPDGKLAFSYEKTKTPFPTESDGVLPVLDTPYGRLSAAICFDMDFPTFANQLGRQGVDIMLVPSFDAETIKPFHTEVALFRAVENGFSLVRQVNAGTSMAVDHQGRVLAYQDFFRVPEPTLIADVPTRGVQTVYGATGDWLPYSCMALVPGLFLLARRRARP